MKNNQIENISRLNTLIYSYIYLSIYSVHIYLSIYLSIYQFNSSLS